ncbi:MAG TPA: tetratricopeptide repeat protein [Allosphingosinicella sp.]
MTSSFIHSAPAFLRSTLEVLAVAESLTDEIAAKLYEIAPVIDVSWDAFYRAIRQADFVEARNSEWSFVPQFRQAFRAFGAVSEDRIRAAHDILRQASEADDACAGRSVPSYLFTEGGKAYHSAALGDFDTAFRHYGQAAVGPVDGRQWLAAKFATEQEEAGVLPSGYTETLFLRAMVLYREGDRRTAERLFREIVRRDEPRIETTVSLNLLARMLARNDPRTAEAMFKRVLDLGPQIGDYFGAAVAAHELANLLSRRTPVEAEALYRQSIEIGEQLNNRHHLGLVLHSFANHISGIRSRSYETEDAYKRAIDLLEETSDVDGSGQAMHSYGNFLARQPKRAGEAERHLRESVTRAKKTQSLFSIAQRLHTLARLVSRTDRRHGEAERMLEESLEIGRRIRNRRHIAMVLRSLANLVSKEDVGRAEQLLRESLALSRESNDQRGETAARADLERLLRGQR